MEGRKLSKYVMEGRKLSKYVMEGRKLRKSKHNCLYFVFFIIMLTTCFGPCAGPSSRHKIYQEENYTV